MKSQRGLIKCSSPQSPFPLKVLPVLTSEGPIHWRQISWKCSCWIQGEVWPGPGEKTQSLHYMQRSSALGTTLQIILTGFVRGVFVFAASVACDRTELYKYQIALWSGCCGCSVYEGKRERGCLKLIIFLTLFSAYWTLNILISVSIFRGRCRSLWLQHFTERSCSVPGLTHRLCPLLIFPWVTFAGKYILFPVL